MYRWFLALRWLLSRPINLLGMFGVMLGVWALIVVVSIFSGFIAVVTEHVQAVGSDASLIGLRLDATYGPLSEFLGEDPTVVATAPRIAWYGLIHGRAETENNTSASGDLSSEEENPSGVLTDGPFLSLVGIDPLAEAKVTGIRDWVHAVEAESLRVDREDAMLGLVLGKTPTREPGAGVPEDAATTVATDPSDLPTILLSVARLRAEGLQRDDVVYLTTGRQQRGEDPDARRTKEKRLSQVTRAFRVGGGFATQHTGFDAVNAFIHIDTLRALLELGAADGVNEISIRFAEGVQAETTAERLTRRLESSATRLGRGAEVWSAYQRNEPFLESVAHQGSLIKLVLMVIMVVAAFLMFATLSMMVSEKTHDVGILTAMGATRGGVSKVFLACGLTITAIGTVLGVVFGCLSAIYLDDFNQFLKHRFDIDLFPTDVYNLDRVPHDLDPWWILQVCVMAMITGIVVSAIPAWRAARQDPLVALRHEN